MDMLFTLIYFVAFSLLALILLFTFLIVTIFAGKSIGDPKFPPVKGTVFNQLFHFNSIYDYHTEIARSHPTFRLLAPGRSKVFTADSRNVEHVLKTRWETYPKGERNHQTVADLLGEGIFAVDSEKWRQQRKLSSFEFSTRVLRDFSCSVFRRNAAKLVRVISESSNAGLGFDMQEALMRCTLDSIFKAGFGVELECLEGTSEEGSQFLKAFDDSNAFVYRRYVDPFWKIKRFLNIGSEAALKNNVKIIDDFVNGLIRTKRQLLTSQQDTSEKEDILSRFLLKSEEQPSENNMTDKYLRDIILNFMIAGKDTSANTMSWFFYMLCKYPLVQEKIAQEVKQVTNYSSSHHQTMSSIANVDEFVANITDSCLDRMHYLHAALTETLRLYPAVPINGRTAGADDILPDGHRINKGDSIYYLAYAMGRMPFIWGPDADQFRPERWLENGTFQPQSPFKFVAFHAGPRICLGRDFAYRQMKIVSMALVRFFRFKLEDETRNVTYKTMFTLHIHNGLPLCAVPRHYA
ncbi:cytochrome P450 704C1-like [Neltuma alba]|uniref:cytochrome P450 704C1-like n=1 Tax=Neltuma alba TaxID=207710 RepID=UPI0010A33B81|nr:cytochrome P450 704C1-like [Prosopis alba]